MFELIAPLDGLLLGLVEELAEAGPDAVVEAGASVEVTTDEVEATDTVAVPSST